MEISTASGGYPTTMGAIVVAAGGPAAMQTLVAAGGCSVAMEAFAVGRRLRSSSGGS